MENTADKRKTILTRLFFKIETKKIEQKMK